VFSSVAGRGGPAKRGGRNPGAPPAFTLYEDEPIGGVEGGNPCERMDVGGCPTMEEPEVCLAETAPQAGSSNRKVIKLTEVHQEGVRGAEHEGVRGAEHEGVRGAEHEGVRGAEHEGVRGTEHEGVCGAEHEGVRGAEHEGVRGAQHAGFRGVGCLNAVESEVCGGGDPEGVCNASMVSEVDTSQGSERGVAEGGHDTFNKSIFLDVTNPFNEGLIQKFLSRLCPPLSSCANYHQVECALPKFAIRASIQLG